MHCAIKTAVASIASDVLSVDFSAARTKRSNLAGAGFAAAAAVILGAAVGAGVMHFLHTDGKGVSKALAARK